MSDIPILKAPAKQTEKIMHRCKKLKSNPLFFISNLLSVNRSVIANRKLQGNILKLKAQWKNVVETMGKVQINRCLQTTQI